MNIEQAIEQAIELQKTLMERIRILTGELLDCHCKAHSLEVRNELLQTALGLNMTAQGEINRLRELVGEQRRIIAQLEAEKGQNLPPS